MRHTLLDAAYMLVLLQDPLRTHRLRSCASERVIWVSTIAGSWGNMDVSMHICPYKINPDDTPSRIASPRPVLSLVLLCKLDWVRPLQACHAHKVYPL